MARELDPSRLGDHVDRLYRAAWALCGSPHEAEDLVQETFVRVLAKPRLLRSDDDLGYLLRALRNTFLRDRARYARRLATASLDDAVTEPPDPRAGLRPDERAEAREVLAAVGDLPEEFRDVLIAVDIAGLSYAEAAGALEIPAGTVMSRLYRARERIAERFDA